MSEQWQSGFPPVPEQGPTPTLPPKPARRWKHRLDARTVLHATPAIIVAATLATIAVRSYEQSHRAAPPPPAPPAPANVTVIPVYGDPSPAALKPEHGNAAARRVCLDETRPLPASGAWTCHSWEPLDAWTIGRKAKDTSGPCTHRVADGESGVWACWTHIAIPALARGMPYAVPVMFGHVLPASPTSQGVFPQPRICRAESRSSETAGAWTCVSSQEAPDGWRFAEPVDPGGPCTYRVADEETGVWSCQSATAQDAR